MSRPLRIEYPGAWFHVMNRGLAKRPIFRTDTDRLLFLSIMGGVTEIYKIEVHAYSLMENHYHLLVHLPDKGLSRAMRHLNGVYTLRVNKVWRSDGPLFRGRYKAKLIESEEYLLEVVRYIHLNPVDAGICKDPGSHPWTSHFAYLRPKKEPSWLVTREILSRFGSEEREAAIKLDRFVQEGTPEKVREALEKGGTVFGSAGFREWVYRNLIRPARRKKEVPLKEWAPKPKVSVLEILKYVAHLHDMPISELRTGGSGRRNDARSLAVYLARHLAGSSHREIARWLRASDGNGIAQIQYRFKARLERERKLRKLTHQISSAILMNVKT